MRIDFMRIDDTNNISIILILKHYLTACHRNSENYILHLPIIILFGGESFKHIYGKNNGKNLCIHSSQNYYS